MNKLHFFSPSKIPSQIIIRSISIFIISTLISFAGFHFLSQSSPNIIHFSTPTTQILPPPTPDPLKPINLALIGYAGGNHDGGNLTDTIILAHLDPRKKTAHLISIPRDSWIYLPTTKAATTSSKINAAFAIGNDNRRYLNKPELYASEDGGGNLLKFALTQMTNITPDYYIAVNFTGFTNIINILGSLEVDVPFTFDDYLYPIKGEENNPCDKPEEDIAAITATMSADLLERQFQCRYEHLHFDQGNQIMDSTTALKFVRSRHSNIGGGDFGRSLRQQALIQAITTKAVSFTTLTQIIPLLNQVSQNVQTDIDADVVKKLSSTFQPLPEFTIQNLSLNTDNVLMENRSHDGQYILTDIKGLHNWTTVHEYIQKYLSKPASPSANSF